MYEIKDSEDGKFYFVLKAGNGEVICTSQMYSTKGACHTGIDSIRINADAEVKDLCKDKKE